MKAQTTKGKIPQAEWSTILQRYDQGESLASISRGYDCTAPAIRYIVKRVRGNLARRPDASARAVVRREPAGPAAIAGSAATDLASHGSGKLVGDSRRSPGRQGPFDRELWDSVSSDIAAFLVAFDDAAVELSPLKIDALIRATDRLVRAGARTRMELERRRLLPMAAAEAGGSTRRSSARAKA